MSSSRKRMLSDSLMSIFIMVALIALNHRLGRIFWHSVGICKSEAPCFRRCRATLGDEIIKTVASCIGVVVFVSEFF
jgi:hypothetical protein